MKPKVKKPAKPKVRSGKGKRRSYKQPVPPRVPYSVAKQLVRAAKALLASREPDFEANDPEGYRSDLRLYIRGWVRGATPGEEVRREHAAWSAALAAFEGKSP